MQDRSDLWKKYAGDGTIPLYSVAVIDGIEYTASSSPVITSGLSSDALSVGTCASAMLEVSILTEDTIAQSAEVTVKARYLGDETTEWLERGTFYVSKRTTDYATGLITLQCYDSMPKANAAFPTEIQNGTWPRAMTTVVSEIAAEIGVEVDERTKILTGDDYCVSWPASYTMLEVLEFIAAVHGGNFVITPQNKLRLVPLASAPDDETIASSSDVAEAVGVTGSLTLGKETAVTGVSVTGTDGTEYTAGDDDGYVITITANPYASQAICDSLYTQLAGVTWRPFEMTGAIYDPAAELGDYITYADSINGILWEEVATLSIAPRMTVSVPATDESDDEYPYKTTAEKLAEQAAKTVADITTYYATSASSTVAPDDSAEWSTVCPEKESGTYIWAKTVTTYSSGSTATSDPVCISGLDGEDGSGFAWNILRGTNTVSETTSTGYWEDGAWRAWNPSSSIGTRGVMEMDVSDTPSSDIAIAWLFTFESGTAYGIAQDYVPLTVGQTYTMSCYARGTGTLAMMYGSGTYSQGTNELDGVSEWTRYTFTFTASEACAPDGAANIYFGNRAAGTIIVCGMMLQTGDTASGWAPSLYDIQGADGKDGTDGTDGRGITGSTVAYQTSDSGVTAPTGTWTTAIPTVSAGEYLWARTIYTYSDGTTDTVYSVSRNGEDGADGTSVNILGTAYTSEDTYSAGSLYTLYSDSGLTAEITGAEAGDAYLVNGYLFVYSETDAAFVCTGVIRGEDGTGITSIVNYYLASALSSGVTTGTSGWTTTVQTVSASKKYLWNYEVTTLTDGNSDVTTPCIIGMYSADGSDGNDGNDGVSITGVVEYYAVSTSNSTAPTTWYTVPQTMDATNKYLWNYEVISYSNENVTETNPRVIGVYGDTGDAGSSFSWNILRATNTATSVTDSGGWSAGTWRGWSPDSAGSSVGTRTSITITDAPVANIALGWAFTLESGTTYGIVQDLVPLTIGQTYTMSCYARGTGTLRLMYGDGTYASGTYAEKKHALSGVEEWTQYSYTFTASENCAPEGTANFYFGNAGTDGTLEVCGMKLESGDVASMWAPAESEIYGEDGASVTISGTSVMYQASSSGTTAPTGTWSESIPSVSQGQYLWTRTIVTYTLTASDGTTSTNTTTSYSVAYIGTDGEDGDDGEDGQMLYATCGTEAGTAAKVATLSSGTMPTLKAGVAVAVTFTYANSAASPTLNVGSSGAKTIHVYGAVLAASSVYNWVAGATVQFVYDGTYWVMTETSALYAVGQWCYDNSKTYINGSTIAAGTIAAKSIVAGSLTSEQINVTELFAQDITATGTITGVTLYAATGEFSGTVTSTSGSNSAALASGGLRLYYDDTLYGTFSTTAWSDDNSLKGVRVGLGSDSAFISFSRLNSSTGVYASTYYIDFDSAINGYVHNFIGTEYHSGAVTFAGTVSATGAATFSSSVYASGGIRMANGTYLYGANTSGTYAAILGMTNGDVVRLGHSSYPLYIYGTISNDLVLANGKTLYGQDTSGSSWTLISMNSYDEVVVGSPGNSAYSFPLYIRGESVTIQTSLAVTSTITSSGNITCRGNVHLYNGGVYYIRDADGTARTAISLSSSNVYQIAVGNVENEINLGTTGYTTTLRLRAGTAITSSVSITTSSDERLKQNITALDDRYDVMLDNMEAVTFEYLTSPGKVHPGFTTQGIRAAMAVAGLADDEFAGVVDVAGDDGETYGTLSYTDLIAPLVRRVQQLTSRVAALEAGGTS